MVSPTRADGTRLTAEERRWVKVLSTLNEAQARWFVADKALEAFFQFAAALIALRRL
jgi:hypothetical protein